MSTLAFKIATHDPNSDEKGVIAGREFFARKFTLTEVTTIAEGIRDEVAKANADGAPFTVKEEMKPVVKALNARLADGGKPITVKELVDTLTEADYRAVLAHYAPSLMGSVEPGNA